MERAELGYWIIAAFQHLKVFSNDADNIQEFDATREAGYIAQFLNAIRGRSVLSLPELSRLAKAQKIAPGRLLRNFIPQLEYARVDRVVVIRPQTGDLFIEENIDTNTQLYEVVADVWETLDPSDIERASVFVLQDTYVRPRTRAEEFQLLNGNGFQDETVNSTVAIAASFEMIRSVQGIKSDETVLFNPYIWRTNHDKIAKALSMLPTPEKSAINETVERVSVSQALPMARLNMDRKLFNTAHAVGLIDIVQVNTGVGDKQEFVFTPHLTTHPDESHLADDLLNDVRAVLACVGYGENYSRISRLGGANRQKTIRTLGRLLSDGEAGDATAIGIDYKLLEERGIITVEPTQTDPGDRFRMVLLRPKPIGIALKTIQASVTSTLNAPAFVRMNELDPGSIFASPEETRIRATNILTKQPQHVQEAKEHFLREIRREVF